MFFKKLMGSLLLGIGLGIFLIEVGIYYKTVLDEILFLVVFASAGCLLIILSIGLTGMAIIEDLTKLFEAKWKNFK